VGRGFISFASCLFNLAGSDCPLPAVKNQRLFRTARGAGAALKAITVTDVGKTIGLVFVRLYLDRAVRCTGLAVRAEPGIDVQGVAVLADAVLKSADGAHIAPYSLMEHEGEENAHGCRDREQDHEKMSDGVEVRPEAYQLHGEHTHEEEEHPDPYGPTLEGLGDLFRRAQMPYEGIEKAPPGAIPVAPLPALEGGDAESEDHAQGDEIAEKRVKPAAAKDDEKKQ
jgi:hypothetical protein